MMGFRFRRSIKIIPGVRLNLSKSGVSTSIGRPGATINIGKRGVRGTVGLPGSGLSYSEVLTNRRPTSDSASYPPTSHGGASLLKIGFVVVVALVAVWAVLAGLSDSRQTKADQGAQVAAITPDAMPTRMPAPSAAGTATVMVMVNCRSQPRKSASVIKTLDEGSAVVVVSKQGRWSKVELSEGSCWVVSDYIG